MNPGIKILTDEQALVRRLREEEGLSYQFIAEGLGLSPARVRQIAKEAQRRLEEHEADPWKGLAGLPARVRNVLENYLDFHSRAELLAAVQSGRLYYAPDESRGRPREISDSVNFAQLRNAGRWSWEQLLLWLGLETAEEQAKRAEELRLRKASRSPDHSVIDHVMRGQRTCPICDREVPAAELPAHLAEHWRAHTVQE